VTLVAEKLRHPKLRALYDYWDTCRAGRQMPARGDIDPLDIPRHLATLILADIEPDPLRVRFRVVGTELESRVGRTVTGDVLDADSDAAFFQPYATCALEARPVHEYARFDFGSDRPTGEFERLLLPLSADGRTVDQVLGEVIYSNLHMPNLLREFQRR
jgi:hypothetical protein